MANKKITDLQLISSITDALNIPVDDTLQTYRATVAQIKAWVLATGNVVTAALANDAVTPAKLNVLSFSGIQNLGLSCSVASNALTISLKTAAGSDASSSDPIKIAFRNSTLATGTMALVKAEAALSTVISSGSTAGHISNKQGYIYVYAINNAGAIELAWSTSLFDENNLISTTAEGGAGGADSAVVMYSTTARSNVAFRLVGRLLTTQTTAGTWAAVPTTIQVGDVGKLDIRQSIAAKYNTSVTSIANAATTTVKCTVKEYDTFDSYDTSTGEYEVRVPGVYKMAFFFSGAAATGRSAGDFINARINKNGTVLSVIGGLLSWSTSAYVNAFGGYGEGYFNVGDKISLAINNPSSTFSGDNSTSGCWVSFEKISD
jgi:hypothetical protein